MGAWLDFFLMALQRQMRRLRAKVEREKLMLGSLPALSARLLDLVRDHGRLTIGDAERLTGENRNTLKQHFRGLVAHSTEGGHRFHAIAGSWFDRRFHGVRLGLRGQGLSCGRQLFACFLR